LLPYNYRTQLTERHLEQVTDSEDSLLELDCFHLTFLLYFLLIVEYGRIWFLKRVVGQSLYNAHHLRDWIDDQSLRVIRKHDGSCTQDKACKDSRNELKLSRVFDDSFYAQSGVRNQSFTVRSPAIVQTLLWSVR